MTFPYRSTYSAPIRGLLEEYFAGNEAARKWIEVCVKRGWEPVIDHITLRCINIDKTAAPYLALGYRFEGETVEYPDQGWWAKVYRRAGHPALFIDQAYEDKRGKKSILPAWVARFTDKVLHHAGVLVPDIGAAVEAMRAEGVEFSGEIIGPRGTRLRQIFTASEVRDGEAFSVLELTERKNYRGFTPEQADALMHSSVKKKSTRS